MKKYTVVWLDANGLDPENSFREKLGDAQVFINPQDCVNYIRTHPDELIYFIVSGHFAKEVVPAIFELNNLIQIFLYCGCVSNYSQWGMDYIDKLMIFDHGDDLLERLWNEIEGHIRALAKEYLQKADEYKNRALKYKQQPCG